MNGEIVSGEKQLLSGRRCPRCLQVQDHIRCVHFYQSERGSVVIYSCPSCQRPIGMETDLGQAQNQSA